MSASWIVDELAHAGPEHLDPAFVAGYDRKQGTDFGPDLAVFLEHGLDAGSTLVDLGMGTGKLVLAAAESFGRVVGVDVSPAMLSHVRSAAESAGLANVECVQAGFLSYEHTGEPADGVFTRNALHQLPDFWKAQALVQIHRILRPGGVLRLHDLIYDFAPDEAPAVFERWFAGAAASAADGYTAEEYAEHIRTEHSTYRWLFEPILAAAGFEIESVSYAGALYGAYICRRV